MAGRQRGRAAGVQGRQPRMLPRPAAALQRAEPLGGVAPRLHAARDRRPHRLLAAELDTARRRVSSTRLSVEARMEILIFAPHWGSNELAPQVFIEFFFFKQKTAYEMSLPLDVAARED